MTGCSGKEGGRSGGIGGANKGDVCRSGREGRYERV